MNETFVKSIEKIWTTKITDSNDLFSQRLFSDALLGYKDALYQSEILNNNLETCSTTGIPYIQVYLLSCYNLANTYLELAQKENAEKLFKRAIYFLVHLFERDIDINEVQRELKRALTTYASFIDENNLDKQLVETLYNDVLSLLKKHPTILK
ncbi:tetratricopeptide repeat protein [Pedobacter sp. KBW06]|nr:tetratricopeptide repeat protein [Pedobacter sp. KBW06]